MLNTEINIQTQQFDGPLALLLLLIQKEEMDVRELDLVKITSQYLQYLSLMKELNFDVAGDYLYLASTLIYLKSKTVISIEDQAELAKLSPDSAVNIVSQEDLIRRLEELQRFQKLAKNLWGLPKKGHEIFVKPKINRKTIIDSILTPLALDELTGAMMDYLERERRKYTVVKRDRLSIKEKLVSLKNNLKMGESFSLRGLLNESAEDGISDIVITFISLLELARLKKVEINQENNKSDVLVNVVSSLDDLDVDQANGFDDENAPASESEDEQVEVQKEENLEETPVAPEVMKTEDGETPVYH
jgi:segregation and condensation protein A